MAQTTPATGRPRRLEGWLLVGSDASGAGKTELACAALRRFRALGPAAVKVTAVRADDDACPRGRGECGVCSSLGDGFVLTEESDRSVAPGKDTSRMLEAGARKVLWLRSRAERLRDALDDLVAAAGDGPVVCESTSLRAVAEPDVFLLVRSAEGRGLRPKGHAAGLERHADLVIGDGPGEATALDALARVSRASRTWTVAADAAAVILAGGRSVRMGRDKASLELGGRAMIERVRDALRPHVAEVVVSAARPDDYSWLGERVIADRAPGEGPLMGIASSLEALGRERALFVACDVPDPDPALARRLLRESRGRDAAVPVTKSGGPEPVFAVYGRSALPAVRAALERGERRVTSFYEGCSVAFVEVERGPVDLDTPEEYQEFADLESRRPG